MSHPLTIRARHWSVAIVAAVVLVVSAIPAPPTATGDELSDARAQQQELAAKTRTQQALVARLQRSQSALQGRIAVTSAALRETVTDLRQARTDIASLRVEVRGIQADYERLVAEVAGLDADLTRTEVRVATKKDELRTRRAQLAERVRAAYDASRRSPFAAIVTGASFTDLLTEMSAQLDAGEQDRALARQISQDRDVLLVLVGELRQRRQQAQTLRQQTAVQKAALDLRLGDLRQAERRLASLQARQRQVLASQRAAYQKLAADKVRLRASIAATKRAESRLEARISRLLAAQRTKGGIPSQFSGSMRWPQPGTISQDYGCTGFPWEPPRGDCANFHNGIDIVAPYGTPVRAAAAGRVLFVGYNPYDPPGDPAWIVIIAHSTSIQTWYAHLQPRRPVSAGDFVQQGDIIGYEGNTGRSSGAHTDWRVMQNGEFVNPRLFL